MKLSLLCVYQSSLRCVTDILTGQSRTWQLYVVLKKPWKCSLSKSRKPLSASVPQRYVKRRNEKRSKPHCTGYPRSSWLENQKKTRRAWTGSRCQIAHDHNGQSITSGSHDVNGNGWGLCRFAINHTDTTGSYISSNHDGTLASLELVQDPVTLVLLLVTVDCCTDN